MSQWHDADDADIEIDRKLKEVDIYVTDGDFGSIYVTLKFAQVAAMMRAIEEGKNP